MTVKKTRNLINMIGQSLASDIADANNNYYIFASKYTEWDNELYPDDANESYYDSDFSIREEMIFGKKINATNVTFLIDRNTWVTDQVWAMYDDRDRDLETKKYYVINSNRDVYKCIYNNKGGKSTIQPVTKTNDVFELADGYKWKYMYTLSTANNTKFGSSTLIPIDANTSVSANAANGSIDSVVIVSPGQKYVKYTTGRIQQVVSNTIFKIDSEKSAANGYYKYSALFITSGTGDSSFSEITNHYTNNSGIFIQTANAMTLALDSNYIIAPMVYCDGDGTNFKAYATVNTTAGQINSVKIVNNGRNYQYANVYFKTDDPDTGFGANIRAVISPPGGHGKDPVKELNSKRLMIKTEFVNNEGATIPTNLKYRKYGLLKNPSNTVLSDVYPYTANTFDATISMTIDILSTNTSIITGDRFVGRSSNAYGKVAFANTTYIQGTVIRGTFVNNEIIDTSNGVFARANSINKPDLDTESGTILFYDTTTGVVRSNTTTEDVGIIFNLS